MQIVLELLIAILAFGGFMTNALLQWTPVNAATILVDILYAVLAVLAWRKLDRERIRQWKTPLLLFGVFALWCLGQVFWGPGISFGQKVMGFRNNVIYPGVWILLALSAVRLDAHRILETIWWCGLLVCAFAILQGLFHHQLPDGLMVLGKNDTRFGFAGEDIFRVTGLVGNTIVFTGFSALVLLLGWMRPERESTWLHKLLELIPAVALYMTYTRAANVAILIVWGFAWSFLRMKRWWCGALRYVLVLIVLVVILSGDAGGTPQSKAVRWIKTNWPRSEFILDRMSGQEVTSEASTNVHMELFRQGFVLFRRHPLVGTGIGSQGYSSHEPSEINVLKDGYWFATLLELGIPGFLLWAVFLAWLARYLFGSVVLLWKPRNADEDATRRLVITLLLVFAYFSIASILNSSYSARTSQIAVWMMVGLLMKQSDPSCRRGLT